VSVHEAPRILRTVADVANVANAAVLVDHNGVAYQAMREPDGRVTMWVAGDWRRFTAEQMRTVLPMRLVDDGHSGDGAA
jgi:hypothetical protein